MPIETSVRTRRPAAAVMALQSAKGTAVDDLRLASGGVRLWTRRSGIPAGKEKNDPRWMNEPFADETASRLNIRDQNDGQLLFVPTPESLGKILESNWGTMAGGVSELKSQVNKFFTLAWIESTAAGSTQKLVRIKDCFAYKLKLLLHRADGRLLCEADYAGIRSDVTPLDSLGSIQITPAPITPSDVRQYNVRNATLVRDPLGANVSLDFVEVEIIVDQQVSSEWTYAGWDVWKRGKTLVWVKMIVRVSDEVWSILQASNAGTKERFRITATSDGVSPSTFTIDLFSLDWKFEDLGHDETMGCLVEATARAFVTASPPESGFVKFTIT